MREEGVATIEDVPGFFIDFTARRKELRIDWWISQESRGWESWNNEEEMVDVIADPICL